MLFNSFSFIALVLITMLAYYTPRLKKYQVHILIFSSLIFYAWSNAALVLLLLSSAGINLLTSYLIANRITAHPKLIAWMGVASNLLILGFFKYAGLIALTFINNTGISEFLISIPLPIGISFFTFQGISLVVDVYKENHFKNKNIIPKSFIEHSKNTLFFISFFPQLVAGPIVKAHEFLPQIKIKNFRDIRWNRCFDELILGYFLKMVVADNLKDFTYWIEFPYFQSKDTFSLAAMLFGYSCQIYADFAGYSFIAIGVARLFGYNLIENFNFPYISSSFREFWKRWHISLSSFLMEYLYIPLGGNRKGKIRTYINLLITMILGGLWHGAAWSYAVWGLFHGMALAVERFLGNHITVKKNTIVKTFRMVFVFSMVSLAWLLFKLPEFSHVIGYLKAFIANSKMPVNHALIINIMLYSSPVLLHHFYYLVKKQHVESVWVRYKFVGYGTLLFLILTNSGIPGEFIYFQF